MEIYRHQVPLWKRLWQHSLTQMMLLSVQAFCGPAMNDAIAGQYTGACFCLTMDSPQYIVGLGGGGLATPQTSNIA